MKEFLVGLKKEKITPELGVPLAGYPNQRPAEKVLDDLYVSSLVIRQDEKTFVWISADLCTLGGFIVDPLREKLYNEFKIAPDNVIVSATHTHSGPLTFTSAGWGEADTDYLNNVFIPKAVEATKKALEDLKPAVMGVGIGKSYAGVNRREMAGGEVILGQNPDGPYDPQLTVLSFKTTDGKNIGSFVHLAIHATACGPSPSITRDWPGVMVSRIEEITNAPCMFVNGAIGDVGPRLSNGKTIANDELMLEVGKIAADDAEKTYAAISEYKVPELKVLSDDMFLPCQEAPSLETVLADIEAMGNPDDLIEVDVKKYAYLQDIKKMHENGEEFKKGITHRATTVAFDDFAFIAIPFEFFCNISLSIRENSPFKNTVTAGLSNGSICYLPTEDQIPYGGYEVESFRSTVIPCLINGLDKHLATESVKLLNKLKNK